MMHQVFAMEGNFVVTRVVLERVADEQFTVVHTKVHDLSVNPNMKVDEAVVDVDDLNLTLEDEGSWIFYPTKIAAIAESKKSLSDYSTWIKNSEGAR
jgi:hypothetical protein